MHVLKIVYLILMSLAFIASFAGLKNRKYVLFIPLLALSLAVELAGEIFKNSNPEIKPWLSLYIAVEYALLSIIISNFIHSDTIKKIIRYSILILVPILVFIRLEVATENTTYKYLDFLIQTPFLCGWTILYLFETARRDDDIQITGNPMFWISLGNLLFFGGSFFSYGIGSYLESIEKVDLAHAIYWIARILNLILYVLYFIGFLCLRTRK